jgi:hypothetical protein
MYFNLQTTICERPIHVHKTQTTFMENNESIDQVIENLDKKIVFKTKSSVLLGSVLFLTGVASLILYGTYDWGLNNLFSQILFVFGLVSILTGLVKFFFRSDYYVSTENKMKIECFEIFFKITEHDKLVRLLESGNITGLKQLNLSATDGLKLLIKATKDGQFCYSQAMAFITNEHVTITQVYKNNSTDFRTFKEIYHSGR